MIYRLPIANGINVSDTNQKSENLNSLSVLPMVDCTGVEYNGTISGWSRRIADNQDKITQIGEQQTDITASAKSFFYQGKRNTVKYNDILIPGNSVRPQTDGVVYDYEFNVTSGLSAKERVFFPPEVIDILNEQTLLKINENRKKVTVWYDDGTGGVHEIVKEFPEPVSVARFCRNEAGVALKAYYFAVTYSKAYLVEADLSDYTTAEVWSGSSDAQAESFCSFFNSYSADVYHFGTTSLFVGRKFFDIEASQATNILQMPGSVVLFRTGSTVKSPFSSTMEDLILIGPYFRSETKTLYVNGVYHDSSGNYYINLMTVSSGGTVNPVWTSASMTKEEAQSIEQWCVCWSEFEYYFQNKRYFRVNWGMKSDIPGIAGISELSGRTENALTVNTVVRIPATIEKNDMMIGGQTDEILSAFPLSNDYLYHSSGRVIKFELRGYDETVDNALIGRGASASRAVSRVKNAIAKISCDSQPIFFDYENRKPLYGCMGYTGAIETLTLGTATDEDYAITYCTPMLMNEIANTLWAPRPLFIHNDVASGKVKVKRRAPKFTGETFEDTDPVFSFFCSNTVTEEVKTVNIRYLYDFSYSRTKVDASKIGMTYQEGVSEEGGIYQNLAPLPVWASLREDNPRVADGGNVTFFCTTNPSSKYRGKGSIGYMNYFSGSYFTNLQGYMFVGGKHFIQIEEALSELQILTSGIQGAVTRYMENVKFDYIGQSQSEGYFLSRADKTLYRYTGYYQMTADTVFSNVPEIAKGQYLPTVKGLILWPQDDRSYIYFIRNGNVSRLEIQGYDFNGAETEGNGQAVFVQEDDGKQIHIYNVNYLAEGVPFSLCYLDYALQKPAGYKQQAFSLDTSYIGIPYTELQVFSVALTFYVELEEGDEIPVRLRYKWRYAESAGSEEADFVIKYDETESDPNGRRFVRFRFIPAVQKVVDFALGISVPNLEKDVTVQSVEFAGVDIEATQKDKPLIGERWSK